MKKTQEKPMKKQQVNMMQMSYLNGLLNKVHQHRVNALRDASLEEPAEVKQARSLIDRWQQKVQKHENKDWRRRQKVERHIGVETGRVRERMLFAPPDEALAAVKAYAVKHGVEV